MVCPTSRTCTSMTTIRDRSDTIRPKSLFAPSISKPPSTADSLILTWRKTRSPQLPSAAMVTRFLLAAATTRSIDRMSNITSAGMKQPFWNRSSGFGTDQNIHQTLSRAGTSSSSTSLISSIVSEEYSAKIQLSSFLLGESSKTTKYPSEDEISWPIHQ